MATVLTSGIYPPIMDTYMPAFVKSSACRIYFKLANFNTEDDISKYVQVSVRHQKNNVSALKSSKYPGEVMFLPWGYDEKKQMYYIQFYQKELKEEFILNLFYKVQLRFMTKDVTNPLTSVDWLNKNIDKFSEWSKVTLIRPIGKPEFSFNSLLIKGAGSTDNREVVINTRTFSNLVGKMTFPEDDIESETIKSYRVLLYNRETGGCVFDSGVQYPETVNEINQKIDYLYTDQTRYRFSVYIETIHGYTRTLNMYFYISEKTYDVDNFKEGSLECFLDEENGRMCIKLKKLRENIGGYLAGDIVFRRCASTSPTRWEEIRIVSTIEIKNFMTESPDNTEYVWYDYTIEPGIMYKYGVEKVIKEGDNEIRRGKLFQYNHELWADAEHMYLTTAKNQLKISFNPNVSNYSKTIAENKTDTIGSKFAYFYRNSHVGYKTFTISGTIHSKMDEDFVFLNKENYSFYNSTTPDKENSVMKNDNIGERYYLSESHNRIMPYNYTQKDEYYDHIYEKKFRELVMDFLYDGNPKLFRSVQEGNIIVRLMNISFSPNQTLGRLTYDFSATAYEMDENNLTNYIKYNLHPLNSLTNISKMIDQDLVRVAEINFNTNRKISVGEAIAQDCKETRHIVNNRGYHYELDSVEWVKFSFPGNYYASENATDESDLIEIDSDGKAIPTRYNYEEKSNAPFIGHVMAIGDIKGDYKTIIIPQGRDYEISKDEISEDNFKNVRFITTEKINSDGIIGPHKYVKIIYKAKLKRTSLDKDNIRDRVKVSYLEKTVGQIHGDFTSGENIISIIRNFHANETENSYIDLAKITKLNIEGDPGLAFKVTFAWQASEVDRTCFLNKTGQLELTKGEDYLYNNPKIYFIGYRLIKKENPDYLHEDEFYISKNNCEVNNKGDIISPKNPKNNYAYKDQYGKYHIYYDNNWEIITHYNSSGTEDKTYNMEAWIMEKSAYASINYMCSLEKGEL